MAKVVPVSDGTTELVLREAIVVGKPGKFRYIGFRGSFGQALLQAKVLSAVFLCYIKNVDSAHSVLCDRTTKFYHDSMNLFPNNINVFTFVLHSVGTISVLM